MSTDAAEIHDVVGRRLRAAEQMYTSGRRQLVELLIGLGRPASIPDLLELRPKLTQSSMYRNMVDLEAAGIVQKVLGTDDRTRFELAEDLIGHHHHLICTQCGHVDDIDLPAAAEAALDEALGGITASTGFTPQGHRFDVLGVCRNCS